MKRTVKAALILGSVLIATVGLAPSASATMPGRNGLIAFTSSTASGLQLFTVRPNGEALHQITHVAGDATNVALVHRLGSPVRPRWTVTITRSISTAPVGSVWSRYLS